MLNKTILLQCGSSTVPDGRLIVGSRTFGVRGITYVRGVELTPAQLRQPFGRASALTITP